MGTLGLCLGSVRCLVRVAGVRVWCGCDGVELAMRVVAVPVRVAERVVGDVASALMLWLWERASSGCGRD